MCFLVTLWQQSFNFYLFSKGNPSALNISTRLFKHYLNVGWEVFTGWYLPNVFYTGDHKTFYVLKIK